MSELTKAEKPQEHSVSNEKWREEWIDYLRGIGIILMFIGHSSIWNPVVEWIYGFHMPLFFILSGYLYNKKKWSESEYKIFLFSRFKSYVIPYFIWCGICFIINFPILWHSYHNNNFKLALIQNLGWILTSVKIDGLFLPQNCTPLWFLTCFFLCQQVFYWIVKLKPIWQCVISAVFIAINYLMNYFMLPILPWHLEVSLIASVFMLAGYYLKEKKLIEKIKNPFGIIIVFVSSSILIMVNGSKNIYYRQYGYNVFVFILASIMMSYSLMWICKTMKTLYFKSIVIKLGIYSIIAMGLNYSVNTYTRGICHSLGNYIGFNVSWIEYLLALINIVVCMLAVFIYKKVEAKNKKVSILIGR